MILAYILQGLTSSHALDNSLARLPPMGWSSWNTFHRNINTSVFLDAAAAMKRNGMQQAGYEYVNIDGGWWAGSDTGTILRNATGFVSVNRQKFPGATPAPSLDY